MADFGLAKLLGQTAAGPLLTASHQIMGTPCYMAPEQWERPQAVDHRADIYSLGVVLYQLLTGELPLGHFAPPSRKAPIDSRFDEVVLRAMQKEPEQRFQQVNDFKAAVAALAGQAVPQPLPPTVPAAEESRTETEAAPGGSPSRWPGETLLAEQGDRTFAGALQEVRGPAVGLFLSGLWPCRYS